MTHPSIQTITVHVINNLSTNNILTMHCHSNDEDLSSQAVDAGSEFLWSFEENVPIAAKTLFWKK
ncbi:hypothetical protein LINPERPRIM_LOCUS13140 [Linum perenne]